MPNPSELLRLVHDLAHMIRIESDRRARGFGMTRAQWFILKRAASSPGLSQREIAEQLEVEPITVARLVDRLEASGLIERRAEPSDRRVWRLYCTEAAAPVLALLDREAGAIYQTAAEGIDPQTLARSFETLQRMKSNIATSRKNPLLDDLKETA